MSTPLLGGDRDEQVNDVTAPFRQARAGDQGLSPEELLARLRADQGARWRRGDRVKAEAYLAQHPALRDNPEAAADLIHGELLLREERGEAPDPEGYLRRFPQYTEALRRQLLPHGALYARPQPGVPGQPTVTQGVAPEPPGGTPDSALAPTVQYEAGPVQRESPSVARLPEVPGYEVLGVLG